MSRGENSSASRSSAGVGHARPPQVAAAASVPMPATDRGVQDRRSHRDVIPLRERCWISVDEACQVAGEGRTKLYELMASNKLLTKKVGRRRLVNVRSLLEYCGE